MDKFYEDLAIQLEQSMRRMKDNDKYLIRILDAKNAIKEEETIGVPDIALIDNLLEDTLRLTSIIQANFDSFEKFMNMYTAPHNARL